MSTLSPERLHDLEAGAVVVPVPAAVIEVRGPGALTCLQGLLTNDLEKPGDQAVVYGALLTAKGAIVVDHWVLRLGERFLLIAEPEGQAATLELLRRSLPPRLARVEDLSSTLTTLRLLGPDTGGRLASAGLGPMPGPGRVRDAGELLLAEPPAGAPFRLLLIGPAEAIARASAALGTAGAVAGTIDDAEAARILIGWPRLGHEILEKTLVQEVRYDEIGGVSYTKGCYTGQETVARLHFRGHTNRELRGLVWQAAPSGEDGSVVDSDGKDVGRVTSRLAVGERWLGLASIRREVTPGTTLLAGGSSAELVALPFAHPL